MKCPECEYCWDYPTNKPSCLNSNPDLLYETRRLYGLIQELKIEIQNPIRNRWMRTSDAAKYANVSTKQIHRAVKAGLLKCGNRAGNWRFKREWIDKYIMNN